MATNYNSNFNEEVQTKIKPSMNQRAMKNFVIFYGYKNSQGEYKPYFADEDGNNIDLTTGADTTVWDLKDVIRPLDPIPNGLFLRYDDATERWNAISLKQDEGQSEIDIMSQKAVTDALEELRKIGLKIIRVDVLPTEGVENRIYLVPSTDPHTPDTYDEYLWIEDPEGSGDYIWQLIGNTGIDLTNYYTIPEVDDLLEKKQDKLIGYTVNILPNQTDKVFTSDMEVDEPFRIVTVMLTSDDPMEGISEKTLFIHIYKRTDGTFASIIREEGADSTDMGVSFHVNPTTGSCMYTTDALTNKLVVARFGLFSFSSVSGGGTGTVTSVNGVIPDIDGNVSLTPQDLLAVSVATYTADNIILNTRLSTIETNITDVTTQCAANTTAVAGITARLEQHEDWIEAMDDELTLVTAAVQTKVDLSSIVQTSGTDSTKVMSQAAVTAYVNSKVGTTFLFVDVLPAVGQTGYIYVAPDQDNVLQMYVWNVGDNQWDLIGPFAADLSDYYTKSQIDALLAAKASVADLSATQANLTSVTQRVTVTESDISAIKVVDATQTSNITQLQTDLPLKEDKANKAISTQPAPAIDDDVKYPSWASMNSFVTPKIEVIENNLTYETNYRQIQSLLAGGGRMTWTGNTAYFNNTFLTINADTNMYRFKFTGRFVVVPAPLTVSSYRYIQIAPPADGTEIGYLNGYVPTDQTERNRNKYNATYGFYMPAYRALYFIFDPNGATGADGTFYYNDYLVPEACTTDIPANAIFIGVYEANGASQCFKVGTGETIYTVLKPASFASGVADYGSGYPVACARKLDSTTALIQCCLRCTTAVAASGTLFTLPANDRPPGYGILFGSVGNNHTIVDVMNSGIVRTRLAVAANAWIMISGTYPLC